MKPPPRPASAAKLAAAERAQARKAERKARRRAHRRCYWMRPLGHRYVTRDGRTAAEVFGNASSGGARPDLACAECGKPFSFRDSHA